MVIASVRAPVWQRPFIWMLLASIVVLVVYWPGLSGPFIFDDAQHLRLLQSWRSGEIGFREMAAGNGNFLFHRSLAMASLALNLMIGGDSSFSFKLGNLLLHMLCGWVAFAVFTRMLKRDANLRAYASSVAACIAIAWLLHPLNVSTVLYVIQRMSQIAALFPLLGVWLYAATRDQMLTGKISTFAALVRLFVGIATLTALGIQGKQSALVLPGLCLVVELGWYQRPRDWPPAIRWFYLLSVALPVAAIIGVTVWKWSWIEGNMLEWGMTPGERLLSEPRALWGYMREIAVPYSPAMGIYTDDFRVSRTWFAPATTMPALLGLLVVSIGAWMLRTRRPAAFVGWFWFLMAHSIEASIVPIELYYEHRNYLPAFGLLLMLLDLLVAAATWFAHRGVFLRKYSGLLFLCLVIALGIQTSTMALQWRSLFGIALAGVEAHPNSARAYIDYGRATIALGMPDDTYRAFERMAENSNPSIASIGKIELTMLNCFFKGDSDPRMLEEAGRQSPAYLNYVVQYAVGDLVGMRERRGCGRITPILLADTIAEMVSRASSQPEMSQSKWTMRYNAAMAYYQGGDWSSALKHARIAWEQSPDPTIALLYVKLLLHNGEYDAAKKVFWQVMGRAGYSEISQIYEGTRGTALRAIKQELDEYAADRGLVGLDGNQASDVK